MAVKMEQPTVCFRTPKVFKMINPWQVKRSQGCQSNYGLNPEVGSNISSDKSTTR